MGHIIYSVPIEEVHLAVLSGIVRTVSYKQMGYNPNDLHYSEDGTAIFLDSVVFVPLGTNVTVTFFEFYEEYFEIKAKYDLAESYRKKYGVREINVWVEDYVSFDGFNEDGSPKFSTGASFELPDTD